MMRQLILICSFGLFFNALFSQNPIDPSRVDIVRDSFGVPHIFAKTDAEVAYGLAWATAEDDFDNAQFLLAAMRGYLGRRMGVEGAKFDFAVQFMGVMPFVDAHYESEIPEDLKRLLEGYAQGVNAFAETHPEKVWFKKMFPVRPQDFVAGYMLAMALMGGVDGTINSIVSGDAVNNIPGELKEGRGSNAFAFNSPKTQTGNAFLAVNAHQPVEGLLSWYEAHVCSEEGWNIIGALFHGAPTIFLGTNENLGWAHTTGQLDETDVYFLKMHPKKKLQYRFDGKWLKLEKEKAKLHVALGKKKKFVLPVGKRFYTSVYGPTMITKKGVFSLRMPALIRVTPIVQWYRMNKARNYAEFMDAVRIQGLSRQNITYADKNDTIYFLSNGLVPYRDRNYKWDKTVPGDTSATLWTEYMPVDSLAHYLNPDCGFVFNTNNAGYEATCTDKNCKLDDFHPHIGYTNEFNNRSMRFYELMNSTYANGKISFDDFARIKFDCRYPSQITFKGKFWLNEMLRLDETEFPDIADAIARMKQFDFEMDLNDRFAPIVLFSVYMIIHNEGEADQAMKDPVSRRNYFAGCIRKAKAHMLQHFGSMDVPLSAVQVIERNGKRVGMDGGPDLIRAVYGNFTDDGRVRMRVGDSYVQLVKFSKAGPEIYSVSTFGASSDPQSPHSNDQMEMFAAHQLKKMSLKKADVYQSAERIYHPGAAPLKKSKKTNH